MEVPRGEWPDPLVHERKCWKAYFTNFNQMLLHLNVLISTNTQSIVTYIYYKSKIIVQSELSLKDTQWKLVSVCPSHSEKISDGQISYIKCCGICI